MGRRFLLIIAILALSLPYRSGVALQKNQFDGWNLQGMEILNREGRTVLQISSTRNAPAEDFLFLGFDQETPAFLRDLSGNFRVERSEYVRVNDARGGTASALFNRRESGVILESPPELWPGSGPLESFQISLYFKTAHLYRRNELLSRIGFLDGYRRGMEILIEDGYLRVSLPNLFQDLDRQSHSYELRSAQRIQLNRWYLLYFSYDASSGKLSLHLNGQEQQVEFAQKEGQVLRAVNPSMDRSPIKLAGHYSGWIDEFRISPLSHPGSMATYDPANYDPYSGRIYQDRSVATSPVLKYSDPLRALELSYRGEEPPGSMLRVEYRISKNPFSANEYPAGPYRYRTLGSAEKLPWDGPAYLQWRITMQPDPSGQKTPQLTALQFNPRPFHVPSRPTGLRVVAELSGPSSVCLEWNRNPESSLEKDGGYTIHVGARSNNYVALLRYSRSQKPIRATSLEFPLTEKEKLEARVRPEAVRRLKQQKIRFIVDRDIIERNRAWLGRREAYPFLESGKAYFFSISAYNHPDSPSDLSAELVYLLR